VRHRRKKRTSTSDVPTFLQRLFREEACALRAVTSTDGMTAECYPYEHAFLGRVAARIINDCPSIRRVTYGITSNPPGTNREGLERTISRNTAIWCGLRWRFFPASTSPMIRLDNISKQNGHQILFIDASMGLQKGEKVELVGPNGAGKTTLFRMIAGEEQPDDGQVTVDPGMTIGYFSQDVGEMSGMSAVAAVMDGVGPVSALATEIASLEAAMADPEQAGRHGRPRRALWRGAGALRGAGWLCAACPGARGARRPELQPGTHGRRRRPALRRLEMRVALARILLMRPDGMLLDEPSNHLDLEKPDLAGGFLKKYEGALLMTSHDREFMNRIIGKVVEIDGGSLITYSGDFDSTSSSARWARSSARRNTSASRRCWPRR